MPNREKLSQSRKVNVGTYPPATQKNWLATIKAKEVEATASSQTPTPTQPAEAPVTQSPTSPLSPDTKDCAICTTLGKICPTNTHCHWTGMKISKYKKGKIRK